MGRDVAPVLQTIEHDLDATSPPMVPLIVSDRLFAGSLAGDVGPNTLRLGKVPEPIGVVTAIVEHRCRSGLVAT